MTKSMMINGTCSRHPINEQCVQNLGTTNPPPQKKKASCNTWAQKEENAEMGIEE
jgi:hypothetical protein